MRTLSLLGGALVVIGAALAFVPRFMARPSSEPAFVGTYVWLGLPVALVGLGLVVWDVRRARTAS